MKTDGHGPRCEAFLGLQDPVGQGSAQLLAAVLQARLTTPKAF